MPVIKPFDTGQLGLQPTEIGVESQAGAGRRLGAFYNQLAQAQEHFGQRVGQQLGSGIRELGEAYVTGETNREVSHGAATFAQLNANLTDQWNTIAKNADPNDASVAAKFRDEVLEPALEKFRGGFNTEAAQNWAEHHVEQLRSHMFEKTSADMATRAAQAARDNVHQTVNTLTNTVYNDPSALKFALDTVDSSVGGIVASSPNLKGAAAGALKSEISEKAREAIVKSAAIGYITKTGNMPDWVTDPAYSKFVNGVELEQFRKAAVAQQKANAYYDRQTLLLQKQEADLKVHNEATDLFAKSVTVDPSDPNKVMVAPDFMRRALDIARNNPNAPSAAATVKTYIDWAESQHRVRAEPVVSDQTVKADLLARIGAPDNPTTEMQVLDWSARDKLSARDTTLLREMVKSIGPEAMRDPLVHSALQGAGERVGAGVMFDGHQRYSNFLQAFWPEYMRQKNAGTLKPNWADFNDETSLIRQTIRAYEPTPDQRLSASFEKKYGEINAQTAPPQPGATFRPPLNWQFNAAKKQYRDPAGNLYDVEGKPVK